MTTKAEWQGQVGRGWAASWQLTDRAFAGLTGVLLERIAERVGDQVLDIGCGAGELSLAIARQRPHARVIGLDVSADLVETAQARAAGQAGVEFALGDASGWSAPGFSPELLVSRHGVMFFDDPRAAFRHLHAIAADEAELVFSCFRSPQENPWASELSALLGLAPPADPVAPGPFAFADPQHVEDILCEAGWYGVGFEPVDFGFVSGAGAQAEDEALDFFQRIGPAARALRDLPDDERERAIGRIREWIARHRHGDVVAPPAAAWIVTAGH